MFSLTLKPFDTIIYKDKSLTDKAQVPAAATLNFYRRGTVVTQATTVPRFTLDWPVKVCPSSGFAVGDQLRVGVAGATLSVSEVDSPSQIKVANPTSSPVSLPAGTRLLFLSRRPTVYADPQGATSLGSSITTSSSGGRAVGYVDQSRFDYVVSGSGIATRLHADAVGSPDPSWINVLDFATIQDAVDAVPPGGGTVYIPAGIYTGFSPTRYNAPLRLPKDRTVHIVGDGPRVTSLVYEFASNPDYDANADLIIVQGDQQTVGGLTLIGGQNLPLGSGVGIRIAKTGSSPGVLRGVIVHDCEISETNSWAVYIDDAVGSQSVPVWTTLERLYIHNNGSNGGIYVGKNSAWTMIRDCNVDSFFEEGIVGNEAHGLALVNTIVEKSANGTFIHASSCNHLLLQNCWLEGTNNAFYIVLDGTYQGATIEACAFRQKDGANKDVLNAVHVSGSGRSVSIEDPEYRLVGSLAGSTSKQVKIEAGCEVVLQGGRVTEQIEEPSGPVAAWPVIEDNADRTVFVNALARLRTPRLTTSFRDTDLGGTWGEGDLIYNQTVGGLQSYRGASGGWAPLTVNRYATPAARPGGQEPGTLIWVDDPGNPLVSKLQLRNGTQWLQVGSAPIPA